VSRRRPNNSGSKPRRKKIPKSKFLREVSHRFGDSRNDSVTKCENAEENTDKSSVLFWKDLVVVVCRSIRSGGGVIGGDVECRVASRRVASGRVG
jgi:hypothetical protein